MPRRTTIARPVVRPRPTTRVGRGAVVAAPITTVLVTVPARDEEASIKACIRSIDRAAHAVPGVDVVTVIAADSCRDDTARVAGAVLTAHARTMVVAGTWRGAGAARAAGVAAGLAACAAAPAAVWLASTDADCVVADDWLVTQLAHAAAGHAATAGIVRLDPTAPARLRADFAATYTLGAATHRHVHAANLGVSAGAYLAVDGWSPHAVVGEEHNLWRRLRRAGHPVVQPVDVVVTTSARTHGRVVGGFASALARLDAQPAVAERSA
jgi:hypothetical protein